MAIGRQLHQAKGQFCNLRNFRKSCFQLAKSTYVISYICDRLYQIFYLQIFLYKSLFSPCNPLIIGFLGQDVRRRGNQPLYKYLFVIYKKLESFSQTQHFVQFFKKVIHRVLLYLTFSFCFLVIFISSKSNFEDVFLEDEWLGIFVSWSEGSWVRFRMQKWKFRCFSF